MNVRYKYQSGFIVKWQNYKLVNKGY